MWRTLVHNLAPATADLFSSGLPLNMEWRAVKLRKQSLKKITAIITIIHLAWRQREHAGHEIIAVYLPYDGWRSVEPNVSECQDLCLLFFLLATLQVEFAIHSEWSQLFYKAIKSFKLEATGVKSLLGVAREGGGWSRGEPEEDSLCQRQKIEGVLQYGWNRDHSSRFR